MVGQTTQSLRLNYILNLPLIQSAGPDIYPYLLHSAGINASTIQATARYSLLLMPASEAPMQGGAALAALRKIRLGKAAAQSRAGNPHGLPFVGGWLVYAGYELAPTLEPRLHLPPPESACANWPTLFVQRCDRAVIVDHLQGCSWLVCEGGETGLAQLQAQLAAGLSEPSAPAEAAAVTQLTEDDPQRFLEAVARIHDYIHAGDVFQVNLSRAWRGTTTLSDTQLYASLLRANPSPFSAMLRLPFGSIISSSPERLCSVCAGQINTRPIAGTRPHGTQPEAERQALQAHPKERAEHVMLVDLERNDLGRIAVPGSVRVDEFMQVESYTHVHHLVSSIRATLVDDCTAADVLQALFPGGTITGCPKIRCMEIIAELEGEGRGPYTGSLGYVDQQGNLDLNILIRTVVLDKNQLTFRTGAGIVADSDARHELAETRAKAEGLLRALGI